MPIGLYLHEKAIQKSQYLSMLRKPLEGGGQFKANPNSQIIYNNYIRNIFKGIFEKLDGLKVGCLSKDNYHDLQLAPPLKDLLGDIRK